MAALPTIPDVYRCALNWVDPPTGQIAENVIHISASGTDANAVAAAIQAHWTAGQIYPTASSVVLQSVTITPLDGHSASSSHPLTGSNFLGEWSGDYIPGTSAVVSFKTIRRGRSYRGRFYTPFLAESQCLNGLLSSAVITNTQAGWVAFQAALVGIGMSLEIASYKHATSQTVTSFEVKSGAGTQRRRQERVRYP
jgi:hypothetical protein